MRMGQSNDGQSVWRSGITKSLYRHKEESLCKHGHRGGPLMTLDVHLGPVMLAEHHDGIIGADVTVEVRLNEVAGTQADI